MRNNRDTNRRRGLSPLLSLILAGIGFAATVAAAASPVDAENVHPGNVRAGSLLFRMANGYEVATRIDTDVSIAVSGLVASVSVRQVFENTGPDWAEGVYVFPLPDRAAVDSMRLRVGERVIESEIRERAAAKKQYERAKVSGRRASLVEQQRANLFTTAVANIAPGERIEVEIGYREQLAYGDGVFGLRFPMTLTPRYMPGAPLADRHGNGWSADTSEVPDASAISPPVVTRSAGHRASIVVELDAGLPLARITSRYHAVDVTERDSRYRVRLASASVPMDHDFELEWQAVDSAEPRASVFVETVDDAPHMLLMVVPPTIGTDHFRTPRETIYIIDTSGSMHGTSMAQAKAALGRALDGLAPGDRFNVIAFDSHPRALNAASVPATPAAVAAARRFVASLRANGGTEMRAALELALSTRGNETHLRQLVFITDGAVGNEEALFELIERRLGPARLFTIGIGSAPNGWFMRKAAEAGRGSYTMIGQQAEVGEKLGRLLAKIERPQLTDIRIDWPGNVGVEAYPATVPDLYAGEPVVVRARLAGRPAPGARLTVRGNGPAGAWQRRVAVPAAGAAAGVGALWARAKIEALTDAGRRGADPDTVRAAIVDTALGYRLVSRHTSLVAVDRTPARHPGEPLKSEQVPSLLPHGQSMNAIFGFPATATDAPGRRLWGMLLLLAAVLLLGASRVQSLHAQAA